MDIEIRYFAAAREACGRSAETLTVPPGTTAGGLLDLLCQRHGALLSLSADLRLAINERFAAPNDSLPAGAVVALIPPVSGG